MVSSNIISVFLSEKYKQKLIDLFFINFRCKICDKDVEGIRFDCIHCESLTFCEKCEQEGTLEHFNNLRNRNKQQHIFQVIRQPI